MRRLRRWVKMFLWRRGVNSDMSFKDMLETAVIGCALTGSIITGGFFIADKANDGQTHEEQCGIWFGEALDDGLRRPERSKMSLDLEHGARASQCELWSVDTAYSESRQLSNDSSSDELGSSATPDK